MPLDSCWFELSSQLISLARCLSDTNLSGLVIRVGFSVWSNTMNPKNTLTVHFCSPCILLKWLPTCFTVDISVEQGLSNPTWLWLTRSWNDDAKTRAKQSQFWCQSAWIPVSLLGMDTAQHLVCGKIKCKQHRCKKTLVSIARII